MANTEPAGPKARRWTIGFGLKLIVSTLLLAVLFWMADIAAALRSLTDLSFWPLVAIVIVAPLGQFISARKWQLLVQAQQMSLRFGQATRLYFIGAFAGLYLPTNIGGDALRLYMSRDLGPIEKVVASIATERVTGITMLLVFALLGMAFGPPTLLMESGLALVWLCMIILIPASLIAIFKPLLMTGIVRALNLRRWGRWGEVIDDKIQSTAVAMDHYKQQKSTLIIAMIWSFLFYVNLVVSQYLHLIIVGADVDLFDVLLIAPLIPLISLIPISINAVGLAESAFVVGYVALGVAPEMALAAALIRRLIYSITPLPGLVFWLQDRGGKLALPASGVR